jgi:hypothetical protein
MKTRNTWIIGIALVLTVIGISTCGTNGDKAKAVQTVSSTAPIDLSGVNWTDLARLMYGRCGEYHDLAISVGWTEKDWKTLSRVMYRESRCNTTSFNKTDPNGGSRGLIQIYGYHSAVLQRADTGSVKVTHGTPLKLSLVSAFSLEPMLTGFAADAVTQIVYPIAFSLGRVTTRTVTGVALPAFIKGMGI